MKKTMLGISAVVVYPFILMGCATTVPTDFRLDFLTAVQSDCAIDKVAVNKDRIQIKCQPIPQEEF